MNLIKNIPLPISGLILALLSLGNLLQDMHPYLRYLFGSIGAIFLILIILKVFFYSESVKQDLKNPVIFSSFATFSMSLMLLSTYAIEIQQGFAYGLWILGLALHILMMIYFTYHFIIRNFDISNIYPSIWIVYVGITMGAITSQPYGLTGIGFIFLITGFISMLITTPAVIYRYIRHTDIPDMNKPLICIFTALFSILIVGYISTAQNISNEFLTILYGFACLFYVFAFTQLIKHIRLEFYPSFSAFTFPFVISALATKGVFQHFGWNGALSIALKVETAVAVLIVIYVLYKYLKFLKKKVRSRD